MDQLDSGQNASLFHDPSNQLHRRALAEIQQGKPAPNSEPHLRVADRTGWDWPFESKGGSVDRDRCPGDTFGAPTFPSTHPPILCA